MSTTERAKIGDNIRGLRKKWGETQLQLALAIGLDNGTTISNYENGRIPERDILIKIAKHYRITETELLYGNYKNTNSLLSFPLQGGSNLIYKFIPKFSSDSAFKSENFRKAHELHNHLWEFFGGQSNCYINDDVLISNYRLCIEYYKQASDQKVIEATANYTGLIALIGLALCMLNQELWDSLDTVTESQNSSNYIDIAFLRDNGFLPGFMEEPLGEGEGEYAKMVKKFLDLYEADFLVGIVILKHSKEYWDLGDYYFALKYAFNISSDMSMTPEMHSLIGRELLYIYGVMQNKYVKMLTIKPETEK